MEADLHKRDYYQLEQKLILCVYADDQIMIAGSEGNLQKGVFTLRDTANIFGPEKAPEKSETMTFLGQNPVRCTVVVDNVCLQHVMNFKYCGCKSSYKNDEVIQQKLAKFAQLLRILNFKPTSVQKFSRIEVYNAYVRVYIRV